MNKIVLPLLIIFFVFNAYCQVDSLVHVTFDFNEHAIKEKNNKVIPKGEGLTLTADRFNNEKSAIYLHGNVSSYLSLGTSNLLKPKHGTISLWVSLDRRVYTGKGYESNPIITTKNGPGEDFISAYSIIYDCYSKRLMTVSSKDSLQEAIVASVNTFDFGTWHNVAVTFDSSYLAFYVDGNLQQKVKKGYETTYSLTDSVNVGHSGDKKNMRFSQGIFDDIQIFHRVLSESEIQDLYLAPNPNRTKIILAEIFKYGIVVLFFAIIIIVIVIRNKRNEKKQRGQLELLNRISELELKVVKAQMNPHFISNCLAAIQELIYKNEIEKAGQYLAKFSFFLRQVLNYSDKNYITMTEEIEIIKLNIELEKLRFKNKFKFYFNIEEKIDADQIMIPSLITQPFIENAIWHGLLPLKNLRDPELKINVLVQSGFPIVEIEDNGIGRNLNISKQNSKGTKLVMDKIESLNYLANTSNYRIEIIDLFNENNEQIGTKVRIQLDNLKE